MHVRQSVFTAVLVGAGVTGLALFAVLAEPGIRAQERPGSVGAAPELPEGMMSSGQERQRLLNYTPDPVKFPIRRTKWDGKPDFSGVYWSTAHPPDGAHQKGRDQLIALYRPEAQAVRAKLDPEESSSMHCWPGSPALGNTEITLHIQMVSSPGYVAVIDQYTSHHRLIPTDGRAHDPSRKPAFAGSSVGHWEGDTLVVDTRNYKERYLSRNDFNDTWSDALHMVERWTMVDGNTLQWEATLEDPKMLTAPWTAPKWWRGRMKGADISLETFCLVDEIQLKINAEQRAASAAGRRRESLVK